MKIKSYQLSGPLAGLCSQHSILISDGACTKPLIYLQRPKWIKDDAQWATICASVKLGFPNDFEIKNYA